MNIKKITIIYHYLWLNKLWSLFGQIFFIMCREGQRGRYLESRWWDIPSLWCILLSTSRMLCFRESSFTSTNRKISLESLSICDRISSSLPLSDNLKSSGSNNQRTPFPYLGMELNWFIYHQEEGWLKVSQFILAWQKLKLSIWRLSLLLFSSLSPSPIWKFSLLANLQTLYLNRLGSGRDSTLWYWKEI